MNLIKTTLKLLYKTTAIMIQKIYSCDTFYTFDKFNIKHFQLYTKNNLCKLYNRSDVIFLSYTFKI